MWVKEEDAHEPEFFIESSEDGSLIRAWSWYLRVCGEQVLTEDGTRDVLRHEGDASMLLKNKIQCKSCNEFIRVRDGTDQSTVVHWVSHKLSCEKLRYVPHSTSIHRPSSPASPLIITVREKYERRYKDHCPQDPEFEDQDDELEVRDLVFPRQYHETAKEGETSAEEETVSMNGDDGSADEDNQVTNVVRPSRTSKRKHRAGELVESNVLCRLALGIEEV